MRKEEPNLSNKPILTAALATLFILLFASAASQVAAFSIPVTEAQYVGDEIGKTRFIGKNPPVAENLVVTLEWENGSITVHHIGTDDFPRNSTELNEVIKLHLENSICKYSLVEPWLGSEIEFYNKIDGETEKILFDAVLELDYPDTYQELSFGSVLWTFQNLTNIRGGLAVNFTTSVFPVEYITLKLQENTLESSYLKIGYKLNEITYKQPTTETAIRTKIFFSSKIAFEDISGVYHEYDSPNNYKYETTGQFLLDFGSVFKLEGEKFWIKSTAKKVWVISSFGRGFGSKVFDPYFGKMDAGSSWAALTSDTKGGCRFYMPDEQGEVERIFAYLKKQGASAHVKAAIYTDSTSVPYILKGTSAEVTVSSRRAQWYTFTFSPSIMLDEGYYWLALITDSSSLRIAYDSGLTNQWAEKSDSYSDGFANPFGTPDAYYGREYSIYAGYICHTDSGLNFFTNAVDVTPGTAGSWQDIDVSSHIPSGSTGVIVELVAPSSQRQIAIRENGSSDDRVADSDVTADGHCYGLCGVDASRIFEGYIESEGKKIYLVGYTDSNIGFFTNGIDKSLGSTGSWIDIDVSGDGVPSGATGVIVEILNTGASTYEGAIRKNGSSDEIASEQDLYSHLHFYGLCGLDANRIFEGYIESTDVDFYLIGYTKDPVTFFTNQIDKSLGSTGSWQDIDVTSETASDADGIIVHIYNTYSLRKYGAIRENGSGDDRSGDSDVTGNGHMYGLCGMDSGQVFEGKIESTSVDFYIIGYTKPSPAGNAPTNDSMTITDMDDTDNVYAQKKWYTVDYDVNDADGFADIDYAEVRIKQSTNTRAIFRFDEDTATFSIQSGSTEWDLDTGSCTNSSSSTYINMTFKFKPQWDATEEADLELEGYVVDATPLSDTDTMQTDYFDAVTNLLASSIECTDANDPDRVDVSSSIQIDFSVRYANDPASSTASSSYPPDAEFTSVSVRDEADATLGTNSSVTNGDGYVTGTAHSGAETENYNLYINMTDADYTDGEETPTEQVITDKMDISFSVDDSTPNLDQTVTFTMNATYQYDSANVTSYTFDVNRNGTLFKDDWATKTFTDTNDTETTFIYDFVSITDGTYGITAFVDPSDLTVTWSAAGAAPVNDYMNLEDPDSGYVLARYKHYDFYVKVTDADGISNLNYVDLKLETTDGVYGVVARWTENGNTFTVESGSGYIAESGSTKGESGNQVQLHFKLKVDWDYPSQVARDSQVYSLDDEANSDTDTYADEFTVETDLTITSFACNDDRGNIEQSLTFTGNVRYTDVNTISPPDSEIVNVIIHDPSHANKGQGATSSGAFSIEVTGESSVGSTTYHPKIDGAGDCGDPDLTAITDSFIADRIRIDSLDKVDGRINADNTEKGQFYATASLEHDGHQLGTGDSLTLEGNAFTWDSSQSQWEYNRTSSSVEQYTIDEFTSGSEATYSVIAGNINSKSASVIYDKLTIYFSANDTCPAKGETVEFNMTATYQFDSQNVTAYTYDVNRDSLVLKDDYAQKLFTDIENTDVIHNYDFISITESGYGLTAFTDPSNIQVTWGTVEAGVTTVAPEMQAIPPQTDLPFAMLFAIMFAMVFGIIFSGFYASRREEVE